MKTKPKSAEECKAIVNKLSDGIMKLVDEAMNELCPLEELRALPDGDKKNDIHSSRWMIAQRAINRCWYAVYPNAGFIFAEAKERAANGRV